MISRRTIFALLVCLLLAGGIKAWSVQHVDACTGFLQGQRAAPATAVVATGDRSVEVPCTSWFLRQSIGMQMLCFLDVLLGVIFLVWLAADILRKWRRRHG